MRAIVSYQIDSFYSPRLAGWHVSGIKAWKKMLQVV
jgi:hypothetical protein